MNIVETERIYGALVRRIALALPQLTFAIAGGAIRDTLMDRPVKDIDFLVESVKPLSPYELSVLSEILDTPFEPFMKDLDEDYNDEDRSQWPVVIYRGVGADIIVAEDIYAYVDDFPDDISMVSIDTLGIRFTPKFVQAHASQNITYRDSAGGDRLQRLLAKYPYSVTHYSGGLLE